MIKRQVAFLIPAHNEELVITETLSSMQKIVDAADIYVVDDGSLDRTSELAGLITKNVLTLKKNVGKATALNLAIEQFKLADRYQYLVPFDADTTVSANFLKSILLTMLNDRGKKIACVVGRVRSRRRNWLTAFRTWEYEVSQTIHKPAQGEIDAIIVCPGCSTLFRAKVFKKIKIPTGTLTEDMDLTFLIHRKKLGKIVYADKASVMTQDPKSLTDFLKQIDRWYTGFWQCVLKHNIPWGGQVLDLEVSLLALEGLFGSLTIMALFLLLPVILFKNPYILIPPLTFDFLLFVAPTVTYTAIRNRSLSPFLYLPQFYFMRVLTSLVFLRSFIKVVLGVDLLMSWKQATRYLEARGEI